MKTLAALGDSQTQPWGWGALPWQTWVPSVARNFGASWRGRAFGVGGDTTTQILARSGIIHRYETPDMVAIYAGVNDPGASISQATTQNNLEALILVAKHGVKGDGEALTTVVADQTALPASGEPGQRYVVLSDTSTTGGMVKVANTTQAATITGTATGPTVWECRYSRAGELGWGRIAVRATAPTVCNKIVVVTANYLNYTTGGDTLTTPFATYAPVRQAQADAVTQQNVTVGGLPSVVLANLYAYQRARIVAGTDPDFSAVAYDQARSWHATQNNQHHNQYGHALVAECVTAAVVAAGWAL